MEPDDPAERRLPSFSSNGPRSIQDAFSNPNDHYNRRCRVQFFHTKPSPRQVSHLERLWKALDQENTVPAHQFLSDNLAPPITLKKVKKYDVVVFGNSPKIRWDMNFSPSLNLPRRDELDPSPALETYRSYLKTEILCYSKLHLLWKLPDFPKDLSRHVTSKRLHCILSEIKSILETIAPSNDLYLISNIWDVQLILQELEMGACNFEPHADTLSNVLIRYCAPRRDERVRALPGYFRIESLDIIIDGLFEILSILQEMRIDTATHLLNNFKLRLINSTAIFGHKFFAESICSGKLNPISSRKWFQHNYNTFCINFKSCLSNFKNPYYASFIDALVKGILLSTDGQQNSLPETLDMDRSRIEQIRGDVTKLIELQICHKALSQVIHHLKLIERKAISTPTFSHFVGQMFILVLETSTNIVDFSSEVLANQICRIYSLTCSATTTSSFEQTLAAAISDSRQDKLQQQSLRLILCKNIFLKVTRLCEQIDNTSLWEIFRQLVICNPVRPRSYITQLPGTGEAVKKTLSAPIMRTINATATSKDCIEMQSIVNRATHIAIVNWRVFAPLIYLNEAMDNTPITRHVRRDRSTCNATSAQIEEDLSSSGDDMDIDMDMELESNTTTSTTTTPTTTTAATATTITTASPEPNEPVSRIAKQYDGDDGSRDRGHGLSASPSSPTGTQQTSTRSCSRPGPLGDSTDDNTTVATANDNESTSSAPSAPSSVAKDNTKSKTKTKSKAKSKGRILGQCPNTTSSSNQPQHYRRSGST